MADKKISELTAITGANTAATDAFVMVDTSTGETKKITREELNNAIEQDVLSTVDINGGTIDGTTIGATTAAAGSFTTVDATGNITVAGSVDGRDVAADGTKLDGIEASATADQTGAEIATALNGETISSLTALTTTGAVIVGGDFTVNGTTTTINSTTLEVDDKNIVLASGAADAAAANGSGITIDGASATFTYVSTGDKWTFNKPIDVTGNIIVSGTVDGRDVATDGTKLDGVEAGATADQTGSEIATALNGETLTGIASATVTGDLTVDTDTLHVDSTNNRVGIGVTSNLGSALTIARNNSFGFMNSAGTASDQIIYGDSSSNLRFYTLASERMRIDSSGNVGIGTTSPTANLHVSGSGARKIDITDTGGANTRISTASNNSYVGSTTNHPLLFITNDTERMRIDSSGNVLIGTDSGDGFNADATLRLQRSGNNYLQIKTPTGNQGGILIGDTDDDFVGGMIYNNGSNYLRFDANNAEKMRLEGDGDLHVDGNVVAYSTTISDIRLKKDIAPIEDAVTKVQQLNGCTFTYLKDDRKSAGLIAQDVEKVLPSAVIEDKAVFHGEEGETYKTVQYDQLIGLLVEAVKELKAEIEELKDAASK